MTENNKTIELLQGILTEMQGMKAEQVKTNVRLESLESGQKETNVRLESVENEQKGMREEQVKTNVRLESTNERLDIVAGRLEKSESAIHELQAVMMRIDEKQVKHTQAIEALHGEQIRMREEFNARIDRMPDRIVEGLSEIIDRDHREFRTEMRSRILAVENRIDKMEQGSRPGN